MGRHFKDLGTCHGPYCSCKKDVITEATLTAAAFWHNRAPNTWRGGEIHLVVAKGESVPLTYLKVISGLSSRKGQDWASVLALGTGAPAMSSPTSSVPGGLCSLAAPWKLRPQAPALRAGLCCSFWTLTHSTMRARRKHKRPSPPRHVLPLTALPEGAL